MLTGAALCDPAVSTWVDGLPADARGVARVFSALGNSNYMLAGSALVAVAAFWSGRSSRGRRVHARCSRLAEDALFVFAAVAASGLADQVLKHVIGRARPKLGGSGGLLFHPLTASNAFASFPSGHATSAFAAATALGLVTARGRPMVFSLAAGVAASRVILGEHYASDVIGGAALGTMVALGLTRMPTPFPSIQSHLAASGGHVASAGLHWMLGGAGRAWTAFGSFAFRHRRWCPPALVAGLFAVTVPPADLFGSELAEHVKDSCAILIALAGLTLRGLVAGFGQASDPHRTGPHRSSGLTTTGLYSLCRHPIHSGNVLIFTGIFLMHGNVWTVLFGTVSYALVSSAIVGAEEDHLLGTFGAAYGEYARRVPRWLPVPVRLKAATRGLRFDPCRMLAGEHHVIGMTLMALMAAEFYEEIEEPLAGAQMLHLVLLGAMILGIGVATGTAWLAGKRRFGSL